MIWLQMMKYLDRVVRGAKRHLRRDSFYSHATFYNQAQ
jgi:hypothetical protein